MEKSSGVLFPFGRSFYRDVGGTRKCGKVVRGRVRSFGGLGSDWE